MKTQMERTQMLFGGKISAIAPILALCLLLCITAVAKEGHNHGSKPGVTCPSGVTLVKPVLECVEPIGNGLLKAHFGYLNDSKKPGGIPVTVQVPRGPMNKLEPDNPKVTLPVYFLPGLNKDVFQVVFKVDHRVSWKLNGWVATASKSSKRCTPAPTATYTPVCRVVERNVRPILDCVQDLGKGKYRAFFGYVNDTVDSCGNPVTVPWPLGEDNRINVNYLDGKQPVSFLPGLVRMAFQADFTKKESISWRLGIVTAEASKYSSKCENIFIPTPTATSTPVLRNLEYVIEPWKSGQTVRYRRVIHRSDIDDQIAEYEYSIVGETEIVGEVKVWLQIRTIFGNETALVEQYLVSSIDEESIKRFIMDGDIGVLRPSYLIIQKEKNRSFMYVNAGLIKTKFDDYLLSVTKLLKAFMLEHCSIHLEHVNVPAGLFDSKEHRFTSPNLDVSLWFSPQVPILGLVKSTTNLKDPSVTGRLQQSEIVLLENSQTGAISARTGALQIVDENTWQTIYGQSPAQHFGLFR